MEKELSHIQLYSSKMKITLWVIHFVKTRVKGSLDLLKKQGGLLSLEQKDGSRLDIFCENDGDKLKLLTGSSKTHS